MDLKDLLKCEICGECFKDPVMLVPCSHNFCSSCIERNDRQSCVICKKKYSSSQIVPNIIIQQFIKCLQNKRPTHQINPSQVNLEKKYKEIISEAQTSVHSIDLFMGHCDVIQPVVTCKYSPGRKKVLCPSCESFVAKNQINFHLDSCLAREEKRECLRKKQRNKISTKHNSSRDLVSTNEIADEHSMPKEKDKTNLDLMLKDDSQADEIKQFIDATFS
uniref:postreplication repair E3 ubiquitin-protein ligase rad18-like isoform X2 n=1 Tax=Ciona intestinalis TaxID=7719 RepID=UPI000180B457|nr:postreplication repair E3 ubiquitin-protein ligase rad18-like isoform X2 [Ciona intestinalis]|eukprot:XP_018672753.1 postreplication repair E3 ubiquitin-protein ligase rad18-like isoform X2 [Ciona intestinalis]